MVISQEVIYYLKVSALSHVEFCPKRSKIELFYNLAKIPYTGTSIDSIIKTGIRLHYEYSYGIKDFDREVVKNRLENFRIRNAFQKQIGSNIIVRGDYDDLRVYNYHNKKYTSLIELKTTNKDYIWSREIKAAIKQLQLYCWLLKETLEKVRYPLWKRHYLEIYSQKTGELIKRITVTYDDKIEEWILDTIDKFNGISKMDVPPRRYCKLCPKQVKSNCSWNTMMEIDK